MASLKAIRNRIRSVRSTQQITRAMKMVAAARLRRAQEAITSARPFVKSMEEVLKDVAARVDLSAHPLLVRRPVKKAEIVVLTSDRGLCGGFNANVLRRVQRFLIENEGKYEQVTLRTIGRKGNEFFRRRAVTIRKDHPGMITKVTYHSADGLALELSQLFLSGEVDAVYLCYNEFVSAATQRVTMAELLPISPPEAKKGETPVDFIYEPGQPELLAALLPRYVTSSMWRAMLESVASEHGARMSAMDNATNNASEMIGKLTLQYNRTRQAGITKELMEIVSGAEALK
ncbi:MAG TPA: ATP synthase F1 subunit gamma [Candidatus Dormibacteraeota bacterium]|nr:ATP synthase F1 subunit gamma [Candidatus Dormibacteraeota bacterium]